MGINKKALSKALLQVIGELAAKRTPAVRVSLYAANGEVAKVWIVLDSVTGGGQTEAGKAIEEMGETRERH